MAQDAGLHGNTKDPRRSSGQIPEVAGLFVFFSPFSSSFSWRSLAYACVGVQVFFFPKLVRDLEIYPKDSFCSHGRIATPLLTLSELYIDKEYYI